MSFAFDKRRLSLFYLKAFTISHNLLFYSYFNYIILSIADTRHNGSKINWADARVRPANQVVSQLWYLARI